MTGPASKVAGLLWLLACFTIFVSLVLYLLERPWWWLIASVSILISQILIILYWHDTKYATLINLVILIAALLTYHNQQFANLVRRDVQHLLTAQVEQADTVVTQQSLDDVPPIVQKWLVKCNVVGGEKIHTVRLKQIGRIRSKPDGRWMAMSAEQFITADKPGFIWSAVIDAGYLIKLNGRDKYMGGKGNMLIKALGLVPIADSSGNEIDQSAMMRYLAEIIWLPTAALNNYIQWEYVNETTARATMNYANENVTGLFFFDRDGDIRGFEGKRYGNFEGHFSLETWSIRIVEYKVFTTLRIGNKCEVTWKLKQGDFTWLQLEVTDIHYNNTISNN